MTEQQNVIIIKITFFPGARQIDTIVQVEKNRHAIKIRKTSMKKESPGGKSSSTWHKKPPKIKHSTHWCMNRQTNKTEEKALK